VFLNWRIKRRIRDLYFAGYHRKAEILGEITDLSANNPAVFERFLRHKKISRISKYSNEPLGSAT
jgi:hypothetical protein